MLELRPSCENCDKSLPPNSTEAMICAYECTFCVECVNEILENVCPNCGGNFQFRPIRPSGELKSNPSSKIKVFKPVDMDQFQELKQRNKNILPENR